MSYIQQYIEKTRGSPERPYHDYDAIALSRTDISPTRLKLDLSAMNESPSKSNAHDQYPMNFDLNESLQSGDDAFALRNNSMSSPDKSPSRSRIPMPPSKRNGTPQSYQELKFGKALDKKLRIKEAEVSRLEHELKALRDSLASKVKETSHSSRDVRGLRSDNAKLLCEIEGLRTDNKTMKGKLATATDERDVAQNKVNEAQKEVNEPAKPTVSIWKRPKQLLFLAENIIILIGFCYLAYYEYKAEVQRKSQAKRKWFGF